MWNAKKIGTFLSGRSLKDRYMNAVCAENCYQSYNNFIDNIELKQAIAGNWKHVFLALIACL
jgi:hypothetical protein